VAAYYSLPRNAAPIARIAVPGGGSRVRRGARGGSKRKPGRRAWPATASASARNGGGATSSTAASPSSCCRRGRAIPGRRGRWAPPRGRQPANTYVAVRRSPPRGSASLPPVRRSCTMGGVGRARDAATPRWWSCGDGDHGEHPRAGPDQQPTRAALMTLRAVAMARPPSEVT